ncbi:hypothetical protein L798_09357 [Zootermopsis nevadensis]|uniref:Uncharacterized protein n=1 Tax=Zootermopsis nevadensis TaxID=136037 RepID=A0A067RAU4_ZOONE|nr:hypothetical protein L798_09357 [Zootermopsis nevadensis]
MRQNAPCRKFLLLVIYTHHHLTPNRNFKILRRCFGNANYCSRQVGAVDPEDLDEETAILKRARKSNVEAEIKQSREVTSEVEKIPFVPESRTQDEEDDFWTKNLDLHDLFSDTDLLSETGNLGDNDDI